MRDSIDAWSAARRWDAVDSVSSRLIEMIERAPSPDSLQLSIALFEKANALWRIRRLRDGAALASAERAAAIRERMDGERGPISSRTLLLASRIASQMARHEHSAALASGVAQWAERQSPPDSSAVLDGQHLEAMALLELGRPDAARVAFDRALAWAPEHTKNTAKMVPVLSDRALFLTQSGEFDEAEAGLRRSLELAALPGADADFIENVLSRLSTLQLRIGDLAESVESASRSLAAARARTGAEAVATLFARVRLANRLQEFGDYRGSLAERRELVPVLDRVIGPSNPTAIGVRLGLSEDLLALGELAAARQELALAREAMQSQPPSRSSNSVRLRLLQARLDRLSGESDRARDTLRIALAGETGDRDGERAAILVLEYLASVAGPADSAALARAIAWVDSLADSSQVRHRGVWCELLTLRSLAELRTGNTEDAWAHALAAESLAHARLIDEVRALPDARGLQLLDRYSAMRDGMIAAVGAPGTAEIAWDRLIEWRESVHDELLRRRPQQHGPTDTLLAAAHERWAVMQRRLARLVVSGSAHADDPAMAARFAEARRDAEDAERQLALLAGRAPSASSAVRLSAVRASLRPGEVLVGYAVADSGNDQRDLLAFVSRSGDGEVQLARLGTVSEARAAIESWTALMSVPPSGDARKSESRARRAGALVRDLLWSPIARLIGDADVAYVVPIGPVEDLPWLALPMAGGRYLADEALELRVLTSERQVIRSDRGSSATTGLLVVGDPEFDRSDDQHSGSAASVGGWPKSRPDGGCPSEMPRLLPLPSARAEALEIAGRWAEQSEALALVGAEAAEITVKRLAPGRNVMHLATHGVLIGDDCSGARSPGASSLRGVGGVAPVGRTPKPSRSRSPRPRAESPSPPTSPWLGRRVWLALAGANGSISSAAEGDENDGLLTAEEVVTLDLRGTDWVVLSACQSGAAEDWAREGVLGMRRAFHLAGARSVIASRWAVADEATRAWMVALYDARPRVHSAGAAVREATREVLRDRRARGHSTHPFYWAAFSATGD